MKILFGAPAYIYLYGPGGVANQMFSTKKSLERLGHEVDLFNPWQTATVSEYDVFHIFFATSETNDLGKRVRSMGPKLVVSPIVDKTINPRIINLANKFTGLLPKHFTHLSKAAELCRLADVSISRSTDETKMLTKAFGVDERAITVVQNGVDPKFASADPSLFQAKYSDDKFLLAVGLIGNPHKNFLRLITAANKLRVKLFLVGPVQKNEYSKACLNEASKSTSVEILGPLPDDELMSGYAAAHALILPSQVEGTGLVALEAGLAGANVAITKNGGPPDYFDQFVTYIDPKSDKSIEAAITASMSAPRNGKLRKHIRDTFTWEKVTAPLVDAYARVIND